jgi:hypothetical protein
VARVPEFRHSRREAFAYLHRDRLAEMHRGQLDRLAGFHGLVVPSGELERDRVRPLIDMFIDVLNLVGDLWSGIERRKQHLWSSLQTAPVRLGGHGIGPWRVRAASALAPGAQAEGHVAPQARDLRVREIGRYISDFRSPAAGGPATAHDIP